MDSKIVEEAKQVGRRIGREVGRERIREGAIQHYVEDARDALADLDDNEGETLADAIRFVADRLEGDVATLLPSDCDAIDEALEDAIDEALEDAEIRKAAREAAADACDDELAGALMVIADDLDRAASKGEES